MRLFYCSRCALAFGACSPSHIAVDELDRRIFRLRGAPFKNKLRA